jgi:hypothetical protein
MKEHQIDIGDVPQADIGTWSITAALGRHQ